MADASRAEAQPIYLNLADADALSDRLGMNASEVEALVRARPHESWRDVQRTLDWDDERINQLKRRGAQLGDTSDGPIVEAGSGGSAGTGAGNLGHA